MNRHLRAFTIVELVLVVVVIGILTGIAIVGWGGMTKWTNDRAREGDTKQWANTFNLYKSRFGVWPALPAGDLSPTAYCLGEFPTDASKTDSYTNGRCVNYGGTLPFSGTLGTGTYVASSGTDFSTFKTAVQKVGKFPENAGKKLDSYAGPFVFLAQQTSGNSVTVTGTFINFFNSCPSGFKKANQLIAASSPALQYAKLTSLLGSSVSTTACGIQQTFTYTTGP